MEILDYRNRYLNCFFRSLHNSYDSLTELSMLFNSDTNLDIPILVTKF